MLYEKWRLIAREQGDNLALRDVASGRRWTFRQLAAAADDIPGSSNGFACVAGHTPEFVLGVLAAWRDGKPLCPLEPGQQAPAIPLPPLGCAHLKTTSASTGRPRLVLFTAAQLAADAANLVITMELRPEWPNVGAISLAHSYGFSNLVLPLLLHGIPLILVPAPLPEVLRNAVKDETAVVLPGVPALWRAWHEAEAIPPSVRLAISAGAPLPLALERDVFAHTGLKIHNFYGSTECGGIAYDCENTPRKDDQYVGVAVSGVNLSVNEAGCMEVRGAAVGETYWPEPDENLRGGCFQTTDLADIQQGRVYLRGRVTEVINVAGRKVSPETIERALAEHPGVRECLVFGAQSRDLDRGDDIVAVVVPRAGQAFKPDHLKSFLLERLPAWQVPRQWWTRDSLLPNPRGKVSRAAWREKYLSGGDPENPK